MRWSKIEIRTVRERGEGTGVGRNTERAQRIREKTKRDDWRFLILGQKAKS